MPSWKTALIFILGYLLSMVGVVAGYTPPLGVLEKHYWEWAMRDLPIFGAASANLVSAFLVLMTAFWGSKGDLDTYRVAILAYSFCCPFAVVLWFLPGDQSKPDWATFNFGVTVAVFLGVQLGIARLLQAKVWSQGGRSAA